MLITHSNNKLVLLFLFVIFSCEKKKVVDKIETVPLSDNQNITIEEKNNTKIHREDLIIKKEEFPCFETSLIKKRATFVDLGSIYTKNDLNTFRRLVESTYLNFYYLQFMNYITLFNLENDLEEANNPKFYFIYALELIKNNNLIEAKIYLERFLDIEDLYAIEKSQYFKNGCDQYDVSWLESPQTALSYKYAKYISDLLEDIIIQNDLSLLNLDNIRLEIRSLDPTKEVIDLSENIELIITKLLSTDKDEIQLVFDNHKDNLLTSSLNAFKDEKDIYFLSSQLDLLVYSKFFIAESILDQFSWDQSFYEELNPQHLKSLLFFYDLERNLFERHNTNLLRQIEKVLDYFNIRYPDNPLPNKEEFLSLLDFYKDIAGLNHILPHSIQYLSLTKAIDENEIEDVLKVVNNLNNLYTNEILTPLDSAMTFLYVGELINSDLLSLIQIEENSLSNTTALPQFKNEINLFKEFMKITKSFSFLNNDIYADNELYYNYTIPALRKHIGFGFYSLETINEIRFMKGKIDPEIPINRGTHSFYKQFNLFLSIVGGQDKGSNY